jgi:hypothetical protein
MCYNKETSITTYIVGSLSSLYLILSKNKSYNIAGTFFLFVSQMQLIEYLIWKHQVKCDDYNIKISNIGSILNHLQPIILYLSINFFNKNIKNKEILNVMIGIYILCAIKYSTYVYPLNCTILDNKNHLFWKWNHSKYNLYFYILFLVTLILLSYFGFTKPYNIIFAFIIIGTYLLSLYKYGNTKAVGAIWCWFAALIPCFIMFYDIIQS